MRSASVSGTEAIAYCQLRRKNGAQMGTKVAP